MHQGVKRLCLAALQGSCFLAAQNQAGGVRADLRAHVTPSKGLLKPSKPRLNDSKV